MAIRTGVHFSSSSSSSAIAVTISLALVLVGALLSLLALNVLSGTLAHDVGVLAALLWVAGVVSQFVLALGAFFGPRQRT